MDDDVGSRNERAYVVLRANVPTHLLDAALQLGVVERGDIERAHGASVREDAAGEMETEEARTTGDRDKAHGERVENSPGSRR